MPHLRRLGKIERMGRAGKNRNPAASVRLQSFDTGSSITTLPKAGVFAGLNN